MRLSRLSNRFRQFRQWLPVETSTVPRLPRQENDPTALRKPAQISNTHTKYRYFFPSTTQPYNSYGVNIKYEYDLKTEEDPDSPGGKGALSHACPFTL